MRSDARDRLLGWATLDAASRPGVAGSLGNTKMERRCGKCVGIRLHNRLHTKALQGAPDQTCSKRQLLERKREVYLP